jgi:hypothetical protein
VAARSSRCMTRPLRIERVGGRYHVKVGEAQVLTQFPFSSEESDSPGASMFPSPNVGQSTSVSPSSPTAPQGAPRSPIRADVKSGKKTLAPCDPTICDGAVFKHVKASLITKISVPITCRPCFLSTSALSIARGKSPWPAPGTAGFWQTTHSCQ